MQHDDPRVPDRVAWFGLVICLHSSGAQVKTQNLFNLVLKSITSTGS